MTILLFLIPMSLLLIGIAAWIFAWAVRHGQFEDLDTPALDILRDDSAPDPKLPKRSSSAPLPPTAEGDDAG